MNRATFAPLICLAAVLAAPAARADIHITATETGGNVVFNYSGSLSPSAFTFTTPVDQAIRGTVSPVSGLLQFGPVEFSSANPVRLYSGVLADAPSTLGTGGAKRCSSATGYNFSIGPDTLGVPVGYVDGTLIAGTATYTGETLKSLGFATSGSPYVWILVNGERVILELKPKVAPRPTRDKVLRQRLRGLRYLLRIAKQRGKQGIIRQVERQIRKVQRQILAS